MPISTIVTENLSEKIEVVNSNTTLAEVRKVWKTLSDQKKAQNSMRQYLIFANEELEFEQNTIKIKVENQVQLDLLNEIKADVMEFIRHQLQNNLIQLEAIISETIAKKNLYTNQDKYNHLLEKFPLLDDLKKRLGLEVK